MCGISGYINTDSRPIGDTSAVISMLKVQKHRGPDDSGIRCFSLKSGRSAEFGYREARAPEEEFEGVLGFNRLSILDLSENGHQPMQSPDGKVILTLNGEIYNAFDYKPELETWGYSFRSTSDTEVVLALYLKYGFDGMLQRLNGMFAIVVADLRSRELYVTRDRFGIKPMYYYFSHNLFAFSSELKSFRYLEGFSFSLREEQLDEYLLFRNNLRGTLYQGVESLEAGNYLVYSHNNGLLKKKYFAINDYERSKQATQNLEYYASQVREWLGRSVKSQLMSDVKLGCQLSGGIDSSLVTWLANRSSEKGNFESVSIVFNNRNFSEEKYVDQVSGSLDITAHKFLLDDDYYLNNIEHATWHMESPLNHPNTVAIYKLSQRAREYVTVLLSGEGADEVFGGYTRFYDIGYPFHLRLLMHEAKKNLTHPKDFLDYFHSDNRAIMATAFMTPSMAGDLKNGFNKSVARRNRVELFNSLSGSLFDRQVKYEMLSYLPDLLIRQDKMSMAHSIENRVPFLDNEVVEKAFTIPEKLLLLRKSPEGRNTEKYLLKKIASDIFGREFGFRDKMGFGIPIRDFFMSTGFNEYLNDQILPGIKQRGLFNSDLTGKWIKNPGQLKYFELEALWVIVSFEIWASIYLDGKYENWNSRS